MVGEVKEQQMNAASVAAVKPRERQIFLFDQLVIDTHAALITQQRINRSCER